MSNEKGLSFHTLTEEELIHHSTGKISRKRVRKREGNVCDCQYCKSLTKDFFSKALAIRNFDEHM